MPRGIKGSGPKAAAKRPYARRAASESPAPASQGSESQMVQVLTNQLNLNDKIMGVESAFGNSFKSLSASVASFNNTVQSLIQRMNGMDSKLTALEQIVSADHDARAQAGMENESEAAQETN